MTANRSTVGIITGLASEARVVGRMIRDHHAAPRLACAGASSARAESLALQLVAEGAVALLSFGIAGGLDPNLPPGTVVLAEGVAMADGTMLECDPTWLERVAVAARAAPAALLVGRLAGSDRVVAGRRDKAALFRQSRALAVDMESHGVAAAARDAGVPFLALRAIADPADQDMPRSVIGSVTIEGEVRTLLVVGRLVLRPWEITAVKALGHHARLAHRALADLRVVAPALFGGV